MADYAEVIASQVKVAAELEGVSPKFWLLNAIMFRRQFENAERWKREDEARRKVAVRPAPWDGWTFNPDETNECRMVYYGPFGASLRFERWRHLNRPDTSGTPDEDDQRPWAAFIGNNPLVNKISRERTFGSADAALAALYKSPAFAAAQKAG